MKTLWVLLLLRLLLERLRISRGSQIGDDVLSISSPFTVITFDQAVVDMVLADMTKITILSSLFFPLLNVFRFCKVLRDLKVHTKFG